MSRAASAGSAPRSSARSREPGATIYLLTDAAGEPLAGNISQLPPGVLDHVGFVDTPYESADDARPTLGARWRASSRCPAASICWSATISPTARASAP